MAWTAPVENEPPVTHAASTTVALPTFRLRPIMRQGVASSIPETWAHFSTIDDARAAAKEMYHDDRVLRAFIVTDTEPPQFVEWVER